MKKIQLLFLIFCFCFQINAQDDTRVEKSLGLSFTASTLSDGYDWGIGLVASQDLESNGLGFGYMVQFTYLQPSDAISSIIDYGYTSDVLLKYDVEISKGFEVAPTAGVGYLGVQSSGASSSEFYFAAGGTASYFIGNSTLIGLEITKPFLDGANISMAFSIRFQI